MKKIVSLLSAFLMTVGVARAVVAPKTPYPYKQPDGSVIMLVNHGDEFHSWVTCNGNVVEKDNQGYYRPVTSGPAILRQKAAKAQARRAQADDLRRQARNSSIAKGQKRFLVLLIEFSDRSFTVSNPIDAFDRMLNQPGYSDNGGTGSARDFYMDNSAGAFKPTFDVYGPVKLPRSYKYYGKKVSDDNDQYPDLALLEACSLLNDEINFADYDLDKDGLVDNVFFYYAGHNQAEGGGDDTIWPHAWSLYRYDGIFDGVRVGRYACSSEYKGASGTNMAGIGTFVHEFGHVLGLPDFYDTDYDKNGEADHPGSFSTMAGGNYLNGGRTPANFTSVERQMLGWMGDFRDMLQSGDYILRSLSGNNLPYVTQTDMEGEEFIYEYRDGTGWDAFLPQGMVIYHKDASDNICYDDVTCRTVFNSGGGINCYAQHPCFYIVPAQDGALENWVFPGPRNIQTFTPVAWSGDSMPYYLSDIRLEGDGIHMRLSMQRMLTGSVHDNEGNPLAGASITLTAAGKSPVQMGVSAPVSIMAVPQAASARYSAYSANDGSFEIILDQDETVTSFQVSVSMGGYLPQSRDIELKSLASCKFVLYPIGTPLSATLARFDLSTGDPLSGLGYPNNPQSIMGAIYYDAEELNPYAGYIVKSISFRFAGNQVQNVYVMVDNDARQRLVCQRVSNIQYGDFTTVDLTEQNIKLEAGRGMYFGYALNNVTEQYPLLFQDTEGIEGLYYSTYSLNTVNWQSYGKGALLVSVTLLEDTSSREYTLGDIGFNAISNPKWKTGYKAGDTFTFKLDEAENNKPVSVVWLFDGAVHIGKQVILRTGKHQVKARLTYEDGSNEELLLDLDVQ